MRFVTTIAVSVGVLLAGAGSADAATTRYVSPSGGGDCSSAASPCTLVQANAAAAPGDTISLFAGDYPALGDVSITPGVTLARALPSGPHPRPVLHVGTLTLVGGALRDVVVSGTTSDSVLAADGTAIDRVVAQVDGGSPASVCRFAALVARDSVCQVGHGAAVAITVSGTSELRNVTADAGFTADGIVVGGPAHLLLHNTSASGATSLVVTDPAAAASVDHSQFSRWSAPPGTVTFGRGNVGFMRFGPPGYGDCHDDSRNGYPDQPANGSLVIDAGGDVGPGETDVLGNPRALGRAPDIGAYEYQPSMPCVARMQVYPMESGLLVDTAVNPHGAGTTITIQWGPTTAYGTSFPPRGWLLDGTLAVPLFTTIPDLAAGVTYHFRVMATNAFGTVYGPDVTYTVPAPASSPTSSPARPKVRIALPRARRCRASRTMTLRPRIAKGGTITAVSVYVRGRRRLRVTGARARRTIHVKHLPAGRYTIEVRVRTKDGRIVKAKRSYKRCKRAT